jgi:3-oxoacyl-[acyl-carrier-protein] synthase II
VNPSDAVWITGVGTCTPLGATYEQFARNMLAGKSGIRRVSTFSVEEHPCQIAGQLDEVPCPIGAEPASFARLHRLEQLMHWCSIQALLDSGLWETRTNLRIGLVLGVGAEWLELWEAHGLEHGREPAWQPPVAADSVAERTARALELNGPFTSVAAACASGNVALAQARAWLRMGWVDVCLAGAGDMAVTPMALAGFGNLRALSRRNAEPQTASRPFDKGRDGFVMGEGGAVFVLERAERARRRRVSAYAEVAGYGASSDAFNMVIPSPDPEPAVAAMRLALSDAAVSPGQVDYVNAHATSTPVGDTAEARVLHTVFGEEVSRIPISSTKSMTGHLLTAAAAVEALACVAAMHHSAIPPTINLNDPDPECNLCHVPHHARERKVRVAVSNSFGFGGSNTCLVLRSVA